MNMDDTAIVGAGLSGLRCASVLQAAGRSVVLLDKSGDSGGRLATRRRSEGHWNHGAPALAAHNPDFRTALDSLASQGAARALANDHYVGVPDMRELTRPLAAPLPLTTSATVSGLNRRNGRWHWRTEEGMHDSARSLVLALPAPQAARLIETAEGLEPHARDRLLTQLESVVMAPCWTLLLGLANPSSLSVAADDPIFSTACPAQLESSEPLPSRHWVVHASPTWSRRHLELDRAVAAESLLRHLNALREEAQQPSLQIEYLRAHRWRYARTERALGEPCLWEPELNLGLAGDWCLGPDAEHAFASGSALARAMLATDPASDPAADPAAAHA